MIIPVPVAAPAMHFAATRAEPRRLALLAGTTVAAALLAGCANSAAIRSASAADPVAELAKAGRTSDKSVRKAEQAVAKAPSDAAARVALAKAYLRAGRFVSAETAFSDAMTLGDASGATALGLALSQIGTGRHADAVVLLDERRADIPAGDLGLALALAGETSRGVAILADAMRGGDSSAKLRQNLAYAYALDGRWAEAKMMAAQDVPADQLDRRMALWALSMLPDRNVDRVASLIGAPVLRMDPGLPSALALASDAAPRMAAAAPVYSAPVEAAPALAETELPAAAPAPSISTIEQNMAVQSAAPQRRSVAAAFAPEMAMKVAKAPARAQPARKLHVAAKLRPVASGTHYVQLGAFSTEQGARRAWGVLVRRNPALAGFRMTISPARVNGKSIWRVAAGGLGDRASAGTLCSSVRSRGDACFAYSATSRALPAPGLPAGFTGPQRARR